MTTQIILGGIVLGFSIAAPVGPIGVLCMRRTLAHGRLAGFLTGLGAATADALYGCIAAFGLGWLSTWLVSGQGWIRPIGAAFIAYLGVKTLLARPQEGVSSPVGQMSSFGAYASALGLTLTNPMTILSFAAFMAGFGFSEGGSSPGLALVCGVFFGSMLWWMLLTFAVGLIRSRISDAALVWINRLSGAVLLVFAGLILAGLVAVAH